MNEDTSQVLSGIEREQLELYLSSDQETPLWMLPLLGLVAWATMATIDLTNPWVTIAMVVVAGATIGATMAVQQKRAGFSPRIAALPEPLRRQATWFLVGGTAVILAGVIVMAFTDNPYRFTIAGGLAFLVIVGAGTWFQRIYRDRAEKLARELGIERG